MTSPPPLERSPVRLAPALVSDLERLNPWWTTPGARPRVPALRRHLVDDIERKLELRLAPVVVVRGSRQIGKTTAQLQVLHDVLGRGVDPRRILRLQCDELPQLRKLDEPILRVADWYEEKVLGRRLNVEGADDEPAWLFVDEVQILADWAPQLKFLVDTSAYRVVATGSSAMRIEAGRDSLAGRITTLESGTLSLTEIARFHGTDLGEPGLVSNGLGPLEDADFWRELTARGRDLGEERDRIFKLFAERGGYPLVHREPDVAWAEIADQLNETIIQRMLKHDLRVDDPDHPLRPKLLEEIFRLTCRYAGQAPSAVLLAREAQRSVGSEVEPEDALDYLDYLGDTLLLRLIPTLEMRLKRGERLDKICLADHSLRASWLRELVPLEPESLRRSPHLAPIAGRLAESVAGASLSTIRGLDIAHRPARKGVEELDFVLVVGLRRIPIEVKYQRRIDPRRDTAALRAFLDTEANEASFGVLVTQADVEELDDPRIVALPLASLLLLR